MDELDPVAVLNAATILFTSDRVAAALDQMAAHISTRFEGQRPVIVAVMHGGVFAAMEIAKRLQIPFEFDYVHATRYGESMTGRDIEWRAPPTSALRNRTVLLVDDVLDRGITLAALIDRLEQVGVTNLHTAVLVRKNLQPQPARPTVDFVGLETGDRYLFGCGMDYKGFWRGLPAIYGVEP